MAMHTIDRVREAELKANGARDAAEQRAVEIIKDAEQRAADIVERAKTDAEARDKAVTIAAEAKSAEIVASHRRSAQESAEALRDKTMNLRQNIINKLIEETLV